MPHATLSALPGARPRAEAPGHASAPATPAPGPATALAFASAVPRAAAAPPPPPGARVLRRTCAQCAAAEEREARTGVPQPLCPKCQAERDALRLDRHPADGSALPAAAAEGGAAAPAASSAAPIHVGRADDPMEREAEMAAERVMGGGPAPALRPGTAPSSLRRAGDGGAAGVAPPQVHAALAEAGRPLDPGTRAFMEARFGRGFGGVRVHTGGAAEASARAVRAQAYTVGSRLVFAAGRYRPETDEGRRLIAHELAHTVQQEGGGPALQRVSDPVLLEPVRPNAQACVVHVHGDERVALDAARELYSTRCVNLAWIDHPGERLVKVDTTIPGPPARTVTCRADPNRVFDNGAVSGKWSEWNPGGPCATPAGTAAGVAAVLAWRDTRLNVAIRQCRGQAVSASGVAGSGVSGGLPVLSMHNNAAAPSATPPGTHRGGRCIEDLTIRSYLPGHCEAGATDTDPVRTRGRPNPQIPDPAHIDEFVLVTDPLAWDRLSVAPTRNAVLQAAAPTQDGSLSVALAAQNYGNVEAKKGGVLATNVALGHAGLDALGVPAGPCASSTGAAAPVGAPSTPSLPTPAAGQITSARVSLGTAERTRFVRHVFDLQVAEWTARGVPYVGSVSPLYTLSPADSLPGATIQLDRGVARASLEPMLRDARAALSAARAAGAPGAAGVTGLRVRSGYRSAASQLGIWTREFPRYYEETAARRAALPGGEHGDAAARFLAGYVNERVITPGYSPHQRAQTVDLTYEEGGTWAEADTTPAAVAAWRASWFFNWLAANAGRYGFRQNPALNEPWHWEYDPLGVAIDRLLAIIEEILRILRDWLGAGAAPAAPADDAGASPTPGSPAPDAPPVPQ